MFDFTNVIAVCLVCCPPTGRGQGRGDDPFGRSLPYIPDAMDTHCSYMTNWNPAQYLKFGAERTHPAADLAARINIDAPAAIADLGCRPANSAQILRDHWPQSTVIGIDNSGEMIEAAKRAFPEQRFQTTGNGPIDWTLLVTH